MRPNYFRRFYSSVRMQTSNDYRIIVSCDCDESLDYLLGYDDLYIVRVKRSDPSKMKEVEVVDGVSTTPAPWNKYFEQMYPLLRSGFVLHIDDDSAFATNNAVARILNVADGPDSLVMYRMLHPNNTLIPPGGQLLAPPKPGMISGSCFVAHHSKMFLARWGTRSFGDYRTAVEFYKHIPNKRYIEDILVRSQRPKMNGLGRRDDLCE